jgi:membrane protease YdiL (CAAX protease family)
LISTRAETVGAEKNLIRRHPLISYFIIAYAGSWLVEALFVLSRDGSGLLPFDSPLDFGATIGIATFSGPALAAFVVTAITEGMPGVGRLLRRIVQWRVGPRWYVFALIGLPAIVTVAAIVLPGVWASRTPMDALPELASYAVFFVYPALLVGGPLGEEIGWRGYALAPMQRLYGPVGASVILGILWAFWHLPIWFSGHWAEPTLANIVLLVAWITAATFTYTWVFNNTAGSVFMAILLHASMDAFPNAILFVHFPEITKMTGWGLYAYWALLLGYGVFAILLVLFTRGRLSNEGARGTT